MKESVKELVAIGASVGAHCQPCLEFHIQAALALGVTGEQIRQAVEIGHKVEKGAMSAMKKFCAETVDRIPVTGTATETVLKIYDPALCCSSGVCGPSVDPVLAQFAGTLKFAATQPGIRIERYNLGQQPQDFVDNQEVKSLLNNGGEKRLPFIFINGELWLQGRYPSKDELLEALNIKNIPILFPVSTSPENNSCCGGGEGCC